MTKLNEASAKRNLIVGIFLVLFLVIAVFFFITTGTARTPAGIVEQYMKDKENDYGVISLTINSIKEVSDEQHIQNIMEDEDARKMDLQRENISLVDACIHVRYDNTKVPTNSGENECLRFVLLRENKNQPWLIAEIGQGRGGIPFIEFGKPGPMKDLEP